MNKGIVIRASIILGIFLLILGLAFGCSAIKDNVKTPEISTSDDVYLSLDSFDFTNEDVWELMKISDGLTYLYQYIDEIVLEDTIASLTDEDIQNEILYAKYATTDADTIAKIQEDAELEELVNTAFDQNLVLLGYNPLSDEDIKEYVTLNAARRKAAIEFITTNVAPQDDDEDTDTSDLYIDDEKLTEYYNANNRGDVFVLDIRFSSDNEGEAVLNKFNLVPNYEGGWGLYFGETPIEDVPTEDFTEENTQALTDEGVFVAMVEVYNYMNPNNQIDPSTSTLNYVENYTELATRSYEAMTEDYTTDSVSVSYATYLFDVLSMDEDGSRYSNDLKTLGNFSMLSFLVDADELTPFDELVNVQDLYDEYLRNMLTSANITAIIDEMVQVEDFEIFEPVLKLQNYQTYGVEFDNKGDETLVATYGDIEITADDLYNYMDEALGTYYSLELTRRYMLIESEYFTAIYGDDKDFLNSNNDNMAAHRDELRTMKTNFGNGAFVSYGYSTDLYSWEEFLIVAFRSYSEATVIRDVYVLSALTPYLLDGEIEYDQAVDYINEQVDNYFSLNASELYLYIDFDQDFEADSWNEVKEAFDAATLEEYSVLKAGLEDMVQDKLDAGESLSDIVTAFQEGLLDDVENEWAEYKAFGFYIEKRDLGEYVDGSLNYNTVQDTDIEELMADFQRIYAAYTEVLATSTEEMTEFLDDRVIETDEGLHFILATEGAAFEQPTAVYDNTAGDYTEGVGNDTVTPSREQVELYIELKYGQEIGTSSADLPLIPSEVIDALEAYYLPFFETYYSSSSYNIQSVEYILANSPQYGTRQAEHVSFLEDALDVLYDIAFLDSFIK